MRLSVEQINLKKKLLEKSLQVQNERVETARNAMETAEQGANDEEPSTEENVDSVREQLRNDREMYAKQFGEAVSGLNTLRRIQVEQFVENVALGAIIKTDMPQNLFISINVGKIQIDEGTFFAISLESPLAKELTGKKTGESILFRDKKLKLLEVF